MISRYEDNIKDNEDFMASLEKDKPLNWEQQMVFRQGLCSAFRIVIGDLQIVLDLYVVESR